MELTKDRQEELIRFTQELVRCPGFSGDEAETAAAVARQMKKLGYDMVEVDPWGNVIGTIRGARPGPSDRLRRTYGCCTDWKARIMGTRAIWRRDLRWQDMGEGHG